MMGIAPRSKNMMPWGLRGTVGVSIAAGLNINQLNFGFSSDLPVLRDLSLTVEPEEIICLLGQSGSGKTTLLRLIAGLDKPDSGNIHFDNRLVADSSHFIPSEKRGIGFVFQDFALFPHLNLLNNVAFGLRNMTRSEKREASLRALSRVGLEAYASAFPHHISGGEQQRVALARAIAPKPPLLLMDEPFSALDRTLRQRVRQETLAIIRETRATSIIVTHDPDEALLLADKIALLQNGKIIQIDRPQDVFCNPATVDSALFFGEINQIQGTVIQGSVETPFGRLPLPQTLTNESHVHVCFRPNALKLMPQGCGVAARVRSRHFLGEKQMIELIINNYDEPFHLSCDPDINLPIDRDIFLNLEPKGVHCFAI